MPIKLSQTVGSNSPAEPYDVKQIKKALNRLGYYTPEKDIGITGFTDSDFFDAIKRYQSSQGMEATGTIRPDDGTALSLSRDMNAKKEGQYIWRTVGDDKVRTEHVQYNGTVRDYADAPDPGEDYNCRCWAENIDVPNKKPQQEATGLSQILISEINESDYKWTTIDLTRHYRNKMGVPLTLEEIGHLSTIIEASYEKVTKKVTEQVTNIINNNGANPVNYETENIYNFILQIFAIRQATVSTTTKATVRQVDNLLYVDGEVQYQFYDRYTDPYSIREFIGNVIGDEPTEEEMPWTEKGGTPFDITGEWTMSITGTLSTKN